MTERNHSEAPEGPLAEARLRLADAAEAWAAKWLAPVACADADEWVEMLQAAKALAVLRAGDVNHVTSLKAENGAPE